MNLGLVLAMIGRYDVAAVESRTTLELDPGNALAKQSLEKIKIFQNAPPVP